MAETENTWRKRETREFLCLSGNKVIVRRPGPDLALKAGKVARILKAQMDAGADVNKQLEFIETLPDDELEKLMAFARILVSDVVIQPPLSLHPKEGQLTPDDVPLEDFWQIFMSGMQGFPDMPVKMQQGITVLPDGKELIAEGETTIEAVHNFPEGQEPSVDAGKDGGDVEGFPC